VDISKIAIGRDATLHDALALLDRTATGVLLLSSADERFERTVTDGDIRRLLLDGANLNDTLSLLSDRQSVTLQLGYTRREALLLMQANVVNHLPVVDDNGKVVELVERSKIDQPVLLSTPHMGESEIEFVTEAFRTNWIAPLGPNVDAFEIELAEKLGIANAVALSSGTAAIHLALRLLDVGPGDYVFCSTLTFAASVNPIVYQGAEPVLIDSEPESWNMSPQALERALEVGRREGKLPKAVIVVSLYGQSADMDPIVELCDRFDVPIIEDAAESLGATYKGKASGSFGRMGIYSFNGNKIITTSSGGMLVTEEKAFADRARFLSTQARDPAPHYQHSTIGYNYRMSNILAGVGRGQLKVLEQRVSERRRIYETYRKELSDIEWIEWMPEPAWSYSTRWLSACTLQQGGSNRSASALIQYLAGELIEARPIWKPMHLQPVFSDCSFFAHGNQPISDRLFDTGLCLPSGSNMSEQQLERTINAIRRYAHA